MSEKKHPRPEQRTLDEQQQALADAYFRRSQCKLQLGTNTPALYDAALEDAINATHYQPDDDDYQLAVATCYIKLKRFEESKKYLQLAVRLMPGDPIVNDHYGDVLWKNGNEIQARYYWNYVLNLEKAEDELKKVIEEKLTKGL